MRSRFTRYQQTVFCKLYRNDWCVYSSITNFIIRSMSGNIFGHEDTEITLLKKRFSIQLTINVWNHFSVFFLPVVTSLRCQKCVLKRFSWQKSVSYFWRQIQILTEIFQKFANISGHGSNFKTSGGRAHAPDICLQLAKTCLPISLEPASE